MLKKAKAKLGSQHTEKTKGLAQAVLDSSHQIWLAGLGAFAKAQQGGTKVFQGLVKQGESLEAKTRDVAAQTAKAARGGVGGCRSDLNIAGRERRIGRAEVEELTGAHNFRDIVWQTIAATRWRNAW